MVQKIIQKGDHLYMGGDSQKWVECAVLPWCEYLIPHLELYPRWRVGVWSRIDDNHVIYTPADLALVQAVLRDDVEVWNAESALTQQELFSEAVELATK